MSQFSIRTRLTVLCAILLALLLGSTAYLTREITTLADMEIEQGRLIRVVETTNSANRAFGDLKYWLSDLAVSLLMRSERKVEESSRALEEQLKHLEMYEPEKISPIRTEIDLLVAQAFLAIEAYTRNERVLGNSLMAKSRVHVSRVDRHLSDLVSAAQSRANMINKQVTEERERAATFSFVIAISGTALGLILTLVVLNSITGPLRRMVGAINSIAHGDYETEIPNAGRDEIGDIAESLRVFRDSLVERDRLAAEHLQSEARLDVSESRFTALIDNLPSAVLLKDTSGRFMVANRKWHEWFNPEGAEITGRTAAEHFPAHSAQVHSQESDILKTGQPSTQELEIKLWDGSSLYTLLQKFPVMDREGRIIGIGGINTDLTPLKEAEVALLRAKEEAELANRSKTVFLANMSHELRTPLNAIIGFSSVMRDQTYGELGDARYRDYAENINRSGEHLLQLISDILDISKIEAGAAEVMEAEIDVTAVIEECLPMVRGRADEKGLNVHVQVPDDFPKLFADQRQVKQIILNLLSNSVKFTPAYGRIEVVAGLSQRRRITLSISDTGIGIAKADVATVLEPFSQIRTRAEHAKEGTGLGLALCKSLIELHGGDLVIESEPGRGTEAIISFPAERTVLSEDPVETTPIASVGAE